MVNDDPRVDRLLRRIEGPLDATPTRAAEDRVWRRLREGHALPGRSWMPAFAVFMLAALLVAGGAYLQSYRVEVASGGSLILYQEHVASTQLSARRGGATTSTVFDATLEIRQGHFSASRPDLLRVVAVDDVHLFEAALPATVEIRYREQGSAVSGTLARTADIGETRRSTGEARHNVTAPLPPVPRGEVHVFEVWLHVDAAGEASDSPVLVVEVRGAAEGERARLLATK